MLQRTMLDVTGGADPHREAAVGGPDWTSAYENELAALKRQVREVMGAREEAERRAARLETSLTHHAIALSDALAQLRDVEASAKRASSTSPDLFTEIGPARAPPDRVVIRSAPPPRRWLDRLLTAAERR